MDSKSYRAMVQRLFKTRDFNVAAEPLMHAAIGIAGEWFELCRADDDANVIEEIGDMEFYLTAAVSILHAHVGDSAHQTHAANLIQRAGESLDTAEAYRAVEDILDLSKKCWVYGHHVEQHAPKLLQALSVVFYAMAGIGTAASLTRAEVLQANYDKLAKRYGSGGYSDAEATARADKEGENAAE